MKKDDSDLDELIGKNMKFKPRFNFSVGDEYLDINTSRKYKYNGEEWIPQTSKVTFNINETVKVKFTEKGYERMVELHNQYNQSRKDIGLTAINRTVNYYKNKTDEQGYYEIQLWLLIQYFGEVITLGNDDYFETDIIFDKSNFKEVF